MSLLFLLCLLCSRATAEGSKELCNNGGYRAFLVSGPTVTPSVAFPTNGTMKVYAKAGEVINVGSSAQGIGFGRVNLSSPNGTIYTSGTSTTVGLIANRAQEIAGPLPTVGGYTPYTHTVLAAEEGVWDVDFISANGGISGGENPVPLPVTAPNWPISSGQYIAAFDVSVRNTANTAFLTGRVYTNIFSGILGRFEVGFNGIFRVLTKDGYIYTLDNNGQAGNGFSFFANNKGFRLGDGTASYKSVNSLTSPNIQDPRAADDDQNITYKIFFNQPATDLPTSAPTSIGNTWLLNAEVAPTLTGITFTGQEGTPNRAGTAPLGANIGFTTNKNGTYTVTIDVNKNGSLVDAVDRKLTGLVNSGLNQVYWDGLDGQGNKVVAGTGYNANVSVVLYGGEVHFPFFDVERNVNGIKLTRLNGPNAPDFTVYWDDSAITQPNDPLNPITPSNPRINLTGINSQLNGHKWGAAGTSDVDFGNEKGLDTWAYIASTTLTGNIGFTLQEANLEVTDINASTTGGCIGQQISYVFTVRNNGPNDVTGATLTFSYPADLTNVVVASTATSGTSSVSLGAMGNGGYTATINLSNGAVRTFTVTGKVAAMPSGGTVTVNAAILRTVDMTDPDATNPDTAPPTDATAECNAPPSGSGCNNIKINTLAFQPVPDAGADQTVYINETATVTATGTGTWSQIGNLPVAAVVASPTAASSTISGLNTTGVYSFLRTSPTGCTDTVLVNVVPKTIDIPSVITPNGDGKNDNFTVPGIELFPGSRLMIYNRWGNEVYKSDSYRNDWGGDSLSEGTYFYVLQRKEPNGTYTTYKGWLFLKR